MIELKKHLMQLSDMGLTAALLVTGAILIAIGILPGHRIEKAVVLAWVLFP